ncbi:site-specific integrase [Ruminococcaceae bacterium OttesenSCG-928-I18]|nr:site-specific integrase [Ruminococcaceae bacterium OttesenSCG-928-I18]
MAKRNAQGTGNIRKRPDGRWEARYTVGRDPGTGKQIQKSVYGKSENEVVKKLQQVHVDLENGEYIDPIKMTVEQWLNIWADNYIGHLKPRTINIYKSHIRIHYIPALGAVKLQNLKPPMIQSFYNKLEKGDKPLSAKSIKNIHGVLHKAMEQAVEVGYLKHNPTQSCKPPRAKKVEIKPLDDTQITTFLQEIKGHKFELPYVVDLFTGMRQSELLGLTWDCVNFAKGTIHIRRQWQLIEGNRSFNTLKNDKERTITPAPFVMQLLQKLKRIQTEWRLQAGPEWHNEHDFIFTDPNGNPLKHDVIYRNFKRIMAKMGIPDTRFHDLRHSYAVAALRAGDDVKVLQENLGHHTAAFTLDIYGHVTEQARTESANRMQQYITRVNA